MDKNAFKKEIRRLVLIMILFCQSYAFRCIFDIYEREHIDNNGFVALMVRLLLVVPFSLLPFIAVMGLHRCNLRASQLAVKRTLAHAAETMNGLGEGQDEGDRTQSSYLLGDVTRNEIVAVDPTTEETCSSQTFSEGFKGLSDNNPPNNGMSESGPRLNSFAAQFTNRTDVAQNTTIKSGSNPNNGAFEGTGSGNHSMMSSLDNSSCQNKRSFMTMNPGSRTSSKADRNKEFMYGLTKPPPKRFSH